LNANNVQELFKVFAENMVNPKPELDYHNNFELLCAVVLSAQTTDKRVNQVTPKLFAIAPDPISLMNLDQGVLEDILKPLGMSKTKSKFLLELAKVLVENFDSKIPETEEELVKIPGVGLKTARVVLNVAFNKETIAVDTHIFRVCTRLGLSNSKNANKMSDELVNIVPKQYLKNAHHYLILHGRYVCTATKPKCENCIISRFCSFYKDIINNS
jgi:endonuclease-3